jgi:protocatechuate 3,4-dioxygenase beta subunit
MPFHTPTKLAVCLLSGALALWAFQATAPTSQAGRAAGVAEKSKDKLASLEGRVLNSLSGEPLKRVTLLLQRTRGGGATPLTVETDDKGNFSFQDIEPGRYLLVGERTGYARQAYGAHGNALSGTALLFSAGQQIKELTFKLAPSSVISGKVLDEDGKGIPNVPVMALRTVYQRGKKQFVPLGAVATNDVGEYRVANLGAGKYLVSATYRNLGIGLAGASNKPLDDKPELSYTTTFYPNSTDPVGASPVQVGVGAEIRGTDIRMVKVNAFRVKGKLSEPPQGKTMIVLLTPKGVGVTGLVTRTVALAQQDGSFEIKGVAPGSYVLSATQDGINTIGATQTVQVADQHVQGVILQPANGGDLPGAVAVEGKDAVSLKDIKVSLESLEILSLSPPQAPIGEDGKFTLKNVAPDRYLVHTTSGPEQLYIKQVRFGSQDATEDGIDVSNGVAGSLQITLSQNGAQVDGTVAGEDGNPVSGATVVLIPDSRRHSLYKEMATDQRGGFSFKGVAPGEYKILAWEDIESGAYQDPEFLKPFESKAQALSLKENDRKVLSLKSIPAESGGKQ